MRWPCSTWTRAGRQHNKLSLGFERIFNAKYMRFRYNKRIWVANPERFMLRIALKVG